MYYLRVHVDKQPCGLSPESEYVELAAEVFAMLADATRVKIILALRGAGELSVTRLAEVVDKSAAGVSQHLAKLRLARMVSTRRDGTTVYYRLTDEHASELVVDAVKQAEHVVGSAHHHRGERGSA
ncbi:ArsR family transcriptional regulator [Curtobacterium citreum]|nr:ArsR family transcriptional regulator [Curtobacterium citreum]